MKSTKTNNTQVNQSINRGNHPTGGKGSIIRRYGKEQALKRGTMFKGKTADLHGKVFQMQLEHGKKGQSKETLGAIRRYAGRVYPLDAANLEKLFKYLEVPNVPEPIVPQRKVMVKVGGEEVTEWDRLKYLEEIQFTSRAKIG